MSKTINILGDTPKQQWKTAIMLYNVTIESNIVEAQRLIRCHKSREDAIECLDTAVRVLGEYRAEMNRLVEGVFDD